MTLEPTALGNDGRPPVAAEKSPPSAESNESHASPLLWGVVMVVLCGMAAGLAVDRKQPWLVFPLLFGGVTGAVGAVVADVLSVRVHRWGVIFLAGVGTTAVAIAILQQTRVQTDRELHAAAMANKAPGVEILRGMKSRMPASLPSQLAPIEATESSATPPALGNGPPNSGHAAALSATEEQELQALLEQAGPPTWGRTFRRRFGSWGAYAGLLFAGELVVAGASVCLGWGLMQRRRREPLAVGGLPHSR